MMNHLKLKNLQYGKLFYPNDLDAQSIQYFLFFDTIEKTSISFNELIHNSVSKIPMPISGIYEIKKQYFETRNKKSKPKKFTLPTNGPAKKNKSEVWRFLRDTTPVNELKKLYQNKCQICNKTFEITKNKFYSEVHHYYPLEAILFHHYIQTIYLHN